MASKKDNLPLSLAKENDPKGTITYANEVIAIIAGVAANEVEGIAGMCSGGGFSDVFVRSRKHPQRREGGNRRGGSLGGPCM